jgi:hypothetical protein
VLSGAGALPEAAIERLVEVVADPAADPDTSCAKSMMRS